MAVPLERNQDATLYVGGLDEKVNEAILWELMVQVKLKFILLSLKNPRFRPDRLRVWTCPRTELRGIIRGRIFKVYKKKILSRWFWWASNLKIFIIFYLQVRLRWIYRRRGCWLRDENSQHDQTVWQTDKGRFQTKNCKKKINGI